MNKLVIYTAIFGGKDDLIEPTVRPAGVDYVCFSDRAPKSSIWDVQRVEPVHNDPVRAAKIYKIIPHRYFPNYECSIWVDGNILVRGDIRRLIEQYLKEVNIAFFDHTETKGDSRSSVYKEAEALLEMDAKGKSKDDPELIRAQVKKYRNEGYPGNDGLIVGMEIIRRHNEPDVVRAMEDWWKEIERHSRRDQLSFNYVAWKSALEFSYMKGDARDNPWFLWKPHIN